MELRLAAAALLGVSLATSVTQRGPLRTADVRGVVFDSIANRAVAGATVQLASADPKHADQLLTAVSDSDGSYHVASVREGRYLIGFYAAVLDSLGIEPVARPVEIVAGEQRIDVAGPSAATVVRTLCGADSAAEHSTLLIGHVHDADTEAALTGARVLATWSEARVANRVIDFAERSATANVREAGWFALCGLPAGSDIDVRGVRGGDSSGAVVVRLSAGTVRHLSLYVGAAQHAAVARLTGHVTDSTSLPIAGAQLSVAGTSRSATSNAAGEFVLDSLPSGTQSLEARAIGYAPRTFAIELGRGAPVPMSIVMQRTVVLPAVVTKGALSSQRLELFEQHRRQTFGGFFVKPSHPDDYPPMQRLHMLVNVPGFTVSNRKGMWTVSSSGRSNGLGEPCPRFFVNGARTILSFDDLENLIAPEDIIGVEVYSGEMEFGSLYTVPQTAGCGLISIWTRDRDEKPTKPPFE